MQIRSFAVVVLAFFLAGTLPSAAQLPRQDVNKDVRLPSGKLQKDEIVKADHAKNLEDAAKLAKMAEDLRVNLEKSDAYVLSVDMLKQTEEIEKLARRIHSRMKKY
jgi:hypothetical protein